MNVNTILSIPYDPTWQPIRPGEGQTSWFDALWCAVKCWFHCDNYVDSEYSKRSDKCICTCKDEYNRLWKCPGVKLFKKVDNNGR